MEHLGSTADARRLNHHLQAPCMAFNIEENILKIAAYVDGLGLVTSAYSDGRLHLYDNNGGDWTLAKEIDFALRPDMRLSEVREAVREAADKLTGCTVFLSAEVRGVVHAILQEEFGFRVWKSQGLLRHQLDIVAAKEAECAAAPPPPAPIPDNMGCGCLGGAGGGPRLKRAKTPVEIVSSLVVEQVGEGHYRVDLARVLARDPGQNSRAVLVPILEGGAFERLEIVCEHVPRWFAQAVTDLGLRAHYADTPQGVTVDVYLDQ